MELLAEALPIILYFFGIVLLDILIVLAIKLISTVDKTNQILDNVEEKAESLDSLFTMIDRLTDSLSHVSDVIVSGIISTISRLFKRKEKKKIEEEDEDE